MKALTLVFMAFLALNSIFVSTAQADTVVFECRGRLEGFAIKLSGSDVRIEVSENYHGVEESGLIYGENKTRIVQVPYSGVSQTRTGFSIISTASPTIIVSVKENGGETTVSTSTLDRKVDETLKLALSSTMSFDSSECRNHLK